MQLFVHSFKMSSSLHGSMVSECSGPSHRICMIKDLPRISDWMVRPIKLQPSCKSAIRKKSRAIKGEHRLKISLSLFRSEHMDRQSEGSVMGGRTETRARE